MPNSAGRRIYRQLRFGEMDKGKLISLKQWFGKFGWAAPDFKLSRRALKKYLYLNWYFRDANWSPVGAKAPRGVVVL